MPMDYEMADYAFAETDAPAMADALLMAKITTVTEEIPQDYSGVKTKTKTVEEVPLLPPMQGPAPMMMATPAPDIGAMPGPAMANSGMPPGMPPGMVPGMAPGMASGAQMMPPQPGAPMQGMQPMPGAGSMGAQAAQQVMQQFGTA